MVEIKNMQMTDNSNFTRNFDDSMYSLTSTGIDCTAPKHTLQQCTTAAAKNYQPDASEQEVAKDYHSYYYTVGFLYSTNLHSDTTTSHAKQLQEVAVDWQEPIMPAAQIVAIQLHALTYNWTRVMQLANTPPLQSTTPGLHPVSIHQMASPV